MIATTASGRECAADASAILEAEQMRAAVNAALASLPEGRRRVVELRCGFDGHPKTFAQIGEELRVPPSVARFSFECAIEILRAEAALGGAL